jgi:Zn-dependent protease
MVDRRSARSALGLLALFVTGGVMAWNEYGNAGVDVFLMVVAGWLVTLSLHEYSHAVFAYRGGDMSVAERGYLTLNPLKYAHPVLSIVLPVLILLLGGIGLPGGAVWIDRHAVRNRVADSLISLAGPGANAVLGIALTLPFAIGVPVVDHLAFWAGIAFLALLQLMAALLNLAPIPGLDGGNALRPWLSPQWGRWFDIFAPYGMLFLFALLFEPRVRFVLAFVMGLLGDLIGLPGDLVQYGVTLFHFWS